MLALWSWIPTAKARLPSRRFSSRGNLRGPREMEGLQEDLIGIVWASFKKTRIQVRPSAAGARAGRGPKLAGTTTASKSQ